MCIRDRPRGKRSGASGRQVRRRCNRVKGTRPVDLPGHTADQVRTVINLKIVGSPSHPQSSVCRRRYFCASALVPAVQRHGCLRKGSNICVPTVETPESDTTYRIVLPTRIAMGLIELIVTVCALSLPSQCEDQHFSFLADMSLNQCVMSAPPYIAQWTNEHPRWVAVRWRCDYGGSKEKT